MDPYDFSIATVHAAGAVLLAARDRGFSTSSKGGDPRDVITSVDIAVNDFIIDKLRESFPHDAIYSEEGGGGSVAERVWAIDPIDGSSNFARGIPHYAICLALLEQGTPTVGVVYNPVTDELFSFKKGEGAFLNGNRISVSACTSLSDSSVFLHAGRVPELWGWGGTAYTALLGAAKKTSNFGGSALDACFVAAGRIEANIYGRLTTMDIAAAIGILLEAGGRMVNERGEPVTFSTTPERILMTNNGTIQRELRAILF